MFWDRHPLASSIGLMLSKPILEMISDFVLCAGRQGMSTDFHLRLLGLPAIELGLANGDGLFMAGVNRSTSILALFVGFLAFLDAPV